MKQKFLLLFLWALSSLALAQPYNGTESVTIIGQAGQTAANNNIVLSAAGTGSYDALRFRSVSIQIIPTGTVSSGTVVFEGSNDNTNFTSVPLFDESANFSNPVTTYSPATSVVRYFTGNIHWRYFRARIGVVIGGGGSLQAVTTFNKESYSPDIQIVGQDDLYFAGAPTQTATVNNIITDPSGASATDLSGYRSGSIQVVSTGTGGTFIFEGSNDNTNFVTIPVWNQLILTGTPITAAITATSSQIIYNFPISFRYIRLRIATTITGGSIRAFAKFSQTSWTPPVFQVAQATAANLNTTVTGTITANLGTGGTGATSLGKAEDAVAASGDTGVPIFGVRRNGPTLTSQASAEGDYGEIATDDGGVLWVRNRPLTYSRLIADGSVKGSAGHIQTITFAPTGTPTAGVITIFDNTTETGTVIFSTQIPASVFTPFTVELNVAATTGIFVGFDATVANVQVTTSFR